MTVSTIRPRRRALWHERWFKPQFLVRTAQHILAAGLDVIKRRPGERALDGIFVLQLIPQPRRRLFPLSSAGPPCLRLQALRDQQASWRDLAAAGVFRAIARGQ